MAAVVESFLCWVLAALAMAAVGLIVACVLVWSLVSAALMALAPWWPVLLGIALIFAMGT